MNIQLSARRLDVAFNPNGYEQHTLVEMLNADTNQWMLLDPTFDLTVQRTADGSWASAEDVSSATLNKGWTDVKYVLLGTLGDTYARSYYIDYPLLFVNVYHTGQIPTNGQGPSVLPYLTAMTMPVNSTYTVYAAACTGGQVSTVLTVNAVDRTMSCTGVNGLSAAFGANTVVTTAQTGSVTLYRIRRLTLDEYERTCPGDGGRIMQAAAQALSRRVDLLGSGPIDLGTPIDWHRDFKTGRTWASRFMRDLDYVNLHCPSDVKIPWEVSRLQWLIPAGQAFLLTGEERYAEHVRQVIDEWIAANPYAHSVNWACTMEAALRIITWTWFFHVFCRSQAWSDEAFQARFLRTLFLHGEFTERYLERASINGNHFTADAAAPVLAGLFFGRGRTARTWADDGWRMLCDELPRQVHPDGVDFEGSVPYHRLVMEMFFLAARYREAVGLDVPDQYRDRVVAMARFVQAYSRPDGSSPLIGDADDARVLPFGGQAIGDHRYLIGLVGAHWCVPDLMRTFSGRRAEVLWTLGRRAAMSLPETAPGTVTSSTAFADGGFYVMRNRRDHVFIDCGPIGTGGLGGHGHNDCLSFEAVLDGVHLVSDCG